MSSQLALRTRVRQQIDESSAIFWTDDTINNYLQEAYNFYWGFIIEAREGYFVKTSTISFDGRVSGAYSLPSDFAKARLVSRIIANAYVPLKYFERYENTIDKSASSSTYAQPCYRFQGANILFEPAPNFSETDSVLLEYSRTLSPLSSTTDVDTEMSNIPLAEDCIVKRATIKCKEQEEMVSGGGSDTSPFIRDLLTTEQMLKENLSRRTVQREYVEQFGEDDNTLIQNFL